MSEMAARSCGETAGMPASMRCTPIAASFLAMATFSSRRKTTPVCCSPSRSVTSWILMFFGEIEGLTDFRQPVPRARKPLLCLPGVFIYASTTEPTAIVRGEPRTIRKRMRNRRLRPAVTGPSTRRRSGSTLPVMNDDPDEARKTTRATPARRVRPSGPSECWRTNSWYFTGSFSSGRFISVPNGPGQIALTVTPVPAHSRASTRVSDVTPALADAYGARPGSAMIRENRAQVDDAAPAALGHVRADGARAQEWPLQVRIEHRVPVGFAQLLDGTADVVAGVVDQDVDRAERGRDLGRESRDIGLLGDIGRRTPEPVGRSRPTVRRPSLRGWRPSGRPGRHRRRLPPAPAPSFCRDRARRR